MDTTTLARLLVFLYMRELGQFVLFILYGIAVVAVAVLLAGVAYLLLGGGN